MSSAVSGATILAGETLTLVKASVSTFTQDKTDF